VTTVYQRLDLADRVALEPSARTTVAGFPDDTLVSRGLAALAAATDADAGWRVELTKRIPVAVGLGGGSSDAATALRLANETLDEPLSKARLRTLAAKLGADVPFFLEQGPQLGEGDGSKLTPLDLPQDYWVVLVLPTGARKSSTADVYAEFDKREGATGYPSRRTALKRALGNIGRPSDLAGLPPNDLASSPLTDDLLRLGAFRADVSGAGPVVYGLFQHRETATAARREVGSFGRTWLTVPTWYG
jgi:4-diphosphocytidyl-2-C-methyl-D-erythritol kinase